MNDQARLALLLLRAGTAGIMVIHGIARVMLGIVGNFGMAIDQWGLPAGPALAWTITSVEIVGGLALAAGYFVRPLAIWFLMQLALGIYFIHGRVGWFVVGAGRNGSEFSVLLMLCFTAIIMSAPAAYAVGEQRRNRFETFS